MISWLNVLYVNCIRNYLFTNKADTELIDESQDFINEAIYELSTFQTNDGGFCWFHGMNSSDLLTLLFLEKAGQLWRLNILPKNETTLGIIDKAIQYIDNRIISEHRNISATSSPEGNISDALTNYIAIRVMFIKRSMTKEVQDILKWYVANTKEGWQEMSILSKAKLCAILMEYKSTELDENSLDTRITLLSESLKDHVVANKTVGCYFPNAVMPFRGLMHTEIYAHAQLLTLFAALKNNYIVNGLAQWILLQKRNQAWENNMATADAVYALISNDVKDLKLGALYYTYSLPMTSLKPTSTGIKVERIYIRNYQGEMEKELKEGDKLRPGEIITVKYKIYNTENRSFVTMTAMRPACFYPKDERSGYTHGAYKEQLSSASIYYFQLLPEGKLELSEEFFVSQEGVFNSGLLEIESLYAPEYRGHTNAFRFK